MVIVAPVTESLASDTAKPKSSPRRFAKRSVILWLAGVALPLALLLPFIVRGQTSLLLIATSASQPIQNKRADADDLSRMRDVAMIKRFRANGYLVPVPVSTRYYYLHGDSVSLSVSEAMDEGFSRPVEPPALCEIQTEVAGDESCSDGGLPARSRAKK